MTNYIGLKCPVCGRTFTADDDIVVCPQCGAPYHRECYQKAGACVYQDKHGTPEAWSPPRAEEQKKDDGDKKRCPRCGYSNMGTALYCEHCGQPLSAGQQPEKQAGQQEGWGIPPYGPPPYDRQRPGGYPPPPPGNYPPQGGFSGGPAPFPFDPMNAVDQNEQVEGVTVADLSNIVQSNSQYYLPVFLNMKHFHASRFNFCAFLFPGAWMLYRKLYKLGAIVTSAMFAIYIAYAYLFVHMLSPLYSSLLQQTGITSDTLSPTTEQIQKLSDLILTLPSSQVFLLITPVFVFILQLAIMLVSGFIGNRMYLRQCLAKIGAIRKETDRPAEVSARLQQEGGVNLALAVCIGICYLILSYIPQLFF